MDWDRTENADSQAQAVEDSLRVDDVRTQPNEAKLAELLLLVAEELADDPFGGAVKVNKVLFFAEFAHMRMTGRPITGVPYQKLPYGPAPRRLPPVRDYLIRTGAATLEKESILGREQHRLRPSRPARREMFAETELQAVTDALALLKDRTATDVSALSHEELGWQLVEEGENIPFVTAYLDPDQTRMSKRIRERAQEIAEQYADRIYHAQ
jgi:antitoxin SocA-like protein